MRLTSGHGTTGASATPTAHAVSVSSDHVGLISHIGIRFIIHALNPGVE